MLYRLVCFLCSGRCYTSNRENGVCSSNDQNIQKIRTAFYKDANAKYFKNWIQILFQYWRSILIRATTACKFEKKITATKFSEFEVTATGFELHNHLIHKRILSQLAKLAT